MRERLEIEPVYVMLMDRLKRQFEKREYIGQSDWHSAATLAWVLGLTDQIKDPPDLDDHHFGYVAPINKGDR